MAISNNVREALKRSSGQHKRTDSFVRTQYRVTSCCDHLVQAFAKVRDDFVGLVFENAPIADEN